MIRALAPLGLIFAALAAPLRGDVLADLSAADQKQVKAGGQVTTTENLDDHPWPRVRVYQTVDATPREVMAVFTDYNNACHFVPNCTKSQISKKVSPLVTDVDYVIDVPIFPDEAYTVRDTLSNESGGALSVSWKVLKATSIQESEGNLHAQPLGPDSSIIRYTNLVKPSSAAAPLLKGMAIGQMKDTVSAIVNQVMKVKAAPDAMKPELERLDAALGGG